MVQYDVPLFVAAERAFSIHVCFLSPTSLQLCLQELLNVFLDAVALISLPDDSQEQCSQEISN